MSKFFVLFLVFTCVSSLEQLVWKVGSAVNVTVGPEDAVYCRIADNKQIIMFDGFGPCRILLDRVTLDQNGVWHIWFFIPGTIMALTDILTVTVLHDLKPVVTSRVSEYGSTVKLTCFVPVGHQVLACVFRDPDGIDFIASSDGDNQEKYIDGRKRYESYAEHHSCTLRLLMPFAERPGIWRCAVNIDSTRDPSYDFFMVTGSVLNNTNAIYDNEPVLKSTYIGLIAGGDALTMACSIDAAIRYCYFWAPNGTVFNVSPLTSSPGYEYVGKGFDAGECGIRFDKVWSKDSGYWSCNVGLKLLENIQERSHFFPVEVDDRMWVNTIWEDSAVVIYFTIQNRTNVEYCRFVRSDGLGFSSENVPFQYIVKIYGSDSHETCSLTILSPHSEYNVRSWTVIAKFFGEDEVSMTTTWDFLEDSWIHHRGLPRTAAILLLSFFSTLFVFVVLVSFLPKKNREWTLRRAAIIRNSFRRQSPQPQPPQQNEVTGLPNPVHTDIPTYLPQKF